MSDKFTKGPWEWDNDCLEAVPATVIRPECCGVYEQTAFLVIQNDADKPLIAAAPDLYKELQDALTSLETISKIAGRKGDGLEHMEQIRGYANSRAQAGKAAIAKADNQ